MLGAVDVGCDVWPISRYGDLVVGPSQGVDNSVKECVVVHALQIPNVVVAPADAPIGCVPCDNIWVDPTDERVLDGLAGSRTVRDGPQAVSISDVNRVVCPRRLTVQEMNLLQQPLLVHPDVSCKIHLKGCGD